MMPAALMTLLLLNTFMIGDHKFNNPSGTTLLELVVTLGIFVMLVGSLIGIFLMALANERRALATQQVLDNTRYTIELMARAIRQADTSKSITTTSCGTSPCLEFTHPVMKGIIQKMKVVRYNFCADPDPPCVFSGTEIKTRAIVQTTMGCKDDATEWCEINDDCSGNKTCVPQAVILTAPNVDVRNLSFTLIGDSPSDSEQPRVTIGVTIAANSNLYPSTDIQTTVALRTPQE